MIPVILYHANVTGFSGGYIGVDIFFVISGYLITSLIIEELKLNTFSIINFYERRIRRLLPALSTVLIVSTICAYILMPANLLKSYSLGLSSVSVFFSNVYFFITQGYFSTISDEKPLIHTWSLAIEEQYYLFFPLLMMLLWTWGRKTILSLIVLMSILSLATAHYLTFNHATDASFYLIFSRAWELFFGSILALIIIKKRFVGNNFIGESLGIIGLILIIYSIIYFNHRTPFPSLYTLLPVIGTCLILAFVNSSSYLGKLLSHRLPVFIGLISYSLYLWHQPILAFTRLKTVGQLTPLVILIAISVSFVLAYLSWAFIEQPFRIKSNFSRKQIFIYAIYSIGALFVVGITGYINDGFASRFEYNKYTNTINYSPKRKSCHTKGIDYLSPTSACEYFNSNITWAALGDSHVVEPAYALAKRLQKKQQGLLHLSFSACPAALTLDLNNPPGCSQWFVESFERIKRDENIKNVLLSFRYSYHLFGNHRKTYPNLPKTNPRINLTPEFIKSMKGTARQNYWESLKQTINQLVVLGKKVYIFYPVPELPFNIAKAVSPFSIFDDKTMLDLKNSTPVDYYYRRNAFILNKLDSLKYNKNLIAIKPFEVFCDEDFCPAVIDGKALYSDNNHLSVAGAEFIIDSIKMDN